MTTITTTSSATRTNSQQRLLVVIEHISFLGALLVGFTERITLFLENRFGLNTPWLIITSVFTLTLLIVWVLTGSLLYFGSLRAGAKTQTGELAEPQKNIAQSYAAAYFLLMLFTWAMIATAAALAGGWLAGPALSRNEVLSLAVVLAGQIALLPSLIFAWKK